MHSSGLPGSSASSLPEWYETYFAAVRETDEEKALTQLEHAVQTLEDRIVQLRDVPPNHPQELEDLGCALTYVRLLLIAPSALVLSTSVHGTYTGNPDGQIKYLQISLETRCSTNR